MNDEFYTILPGALLNKASIDDGTHKAACFDAILCDGSITKLSAKGDTLTPNVADISALSTGIYAASDAACVTVSSPVIQGLFSEVYNHSTGDIIRVHVLKSY
jgi:hypothetical protein